jgi:hypothetical protein
LRATKYPTDTTNDKRCKIDPSFASAKLSNQPSLLQRTNQLCTIHLKPVENADDRQLNYHAIGDERELSYNGIVEYHPFKAC